MEVSIVIFAFVVLFVRRKHNDVDRDKLYFGVLAFFISGVEVTFPTKEKVK